MFCTGHTELSNHMCIYYSAAVAVTCKKDVGMGYVHVCVTLCFMSSPLPLHTAMPLYPVFSVGSQLLRLFMLQVAEASRIHLSYPVAAAAWSCLSSEKIRDQKKYPQK